MKNCLLIKHEETRAVVCATAFDLLTNVGKITYKNAFYLFTNIQMYARVETDKTKEGTRHEKEIWYLQV